MMDLGTAAGWLLLVGFEQGAFDEQLALLLEEIRPGGGRHWRGRGLSGLRQEKGAWELAGAAVHDWRRV